MASACLATILRAAVKKSLRDISPDNHCKSIGEAYRTPQDGISNSKAAGTGRRNMASYFSNPVRGSA